MTIIYNNPLQTMRKRRVIVEGPTRREEGREKGREEKSRKRTSNSLVRNPFGRSHQAMMAMITMANSAHLMA